jgi:hypothetical protein
MQSKPQAVARVQQPSELESPEVDEDWLAELPLARLLALLLKPPPSLAGSHEQGP